MKPHEITPEALKARAHVGNRKVVVHEAIHRGLFLCGGRWRDERLVARLTRDAGRAA